MVNNKHDTRGIPNSSLQGLMLKFCPRYSLYGILLCTREVVSMRRISVSNTVLVWEGSL